MLQVVQAHSNIQKHEIDFDNFSQFTIFYQVLDSEICVLLEQSPKTRQQELPNPRRRLKPYSRNLALALNTIVMARFSYANEMTTLWSILRAMTLLMSRSIKQVEE